MNKSKILLSALILLILLLIIPSSASALTFEIDNQSGKNPDDVWVTVAGDSYDVPGMSNNVPVQLSSIPNQQITINSIVSGRIYISYNQGVTVQVPFSSSTRFDWAELTVTPNASDVANLTAVDQFGIGMRLLTYNQQGDQLEEIGTANSNTVFNAFQAIPGGPGATVRDANNNILRVLSPNHTNAYPLLTEYVQSMAGKTINLNTAFYGSPFVTSSYSGTFESDGSITLTGTTNPANQAPDQFTIDGSQLISDIYTGANTPNTLEGAIRRDVLAGFSTGMWDGKYGNNALDFCSNPINNQQGSWCPDGFNKPSFGDARSSLSAFPTCEQYSAVINEYSDSYGNPYSDASKKVTVGLNQPGTGGTVSKLKLLIQPDSGTAQPVTSGNANCGAAAPTPPPPVRPVKTIILFKKVVFKGKQAKVGKVICSKACGKTRVVIKQGKKVVAKSYSVIKNKQTILRVKLTKYGLKKFKRSKKINAKAYTWVTPAQSKTYSLSTKIVVYKKR
jgi:hypothetical protein